MQRLLLAGLAVAAVLGRAADAAELARPPLIYQPVAVVAAPYNWTGCYLGANVGALRANLVTLPSDWILAATRRVAALGGCRPTATIRSLHG